MDNSKNSLHSNVEAEANILASRLLRLLSLYEGNHVITKDVRDQLILFLQSQRTKSFATATVLSHLIYMNLTSPYKRKTDIHGIWHWYQAYEFGFHNRDNFFKAIRALNKVWGQLVSIRCEVYGRKTNPVTITLSLLF